jgi:hypothetical protein
MDEYTYVVETGVPTPHTTNSESLPIGPMIIGIVGLIIVLWVMVKYWR